MTLNDVERRDSRNQIFQVDLLNNAGDVWHKAEPPNSAEQDRRGRGIFLVSQLHHQWGGGTPVLPNFGGSQVPYFQH